MTRTASPIPTPIYRAAQPTTAPPTFSPTPVPTPNPSALAIRHCRAEDLMVQFAGSQGATGNILLGFGVGNVSGETCRVQGAPTLVQIRATSESTTSPPCRSSGSCPTTVTLVEPGPAPQPTHGPYTAWFTVVYGNSLTRGEACPGEWMDLAIELPDNGGRINLVDGRVPACAHPGVTQFVHQPLPMPTPDPTVGYR